VLQCVEVLTTDAGEAELVWYVSFTCLIQTSHSHGSFTRRIHMSHSYLAWHHPLALLSVYGALSSVFRALSSVYRALSSVYRALLSVYRALLSVCV